MSTLLSLPREILVEIIEDTRPDSIRSFVTCCKSMWILGARVLQQHQYDVNGYQNSKIDLYFPMFRRGAATHPYTFLSDILLKPRRALYVKTLLVQDAKWNDPTYEQSLKATHRELVSVTLNEPCGLLFRGIVDCPYIHDNATSEWVASFRRGDTYKVASLALTLLPNLEVLSLINYWEGQSCAELIFEILKTNHSPHCKILDPLPLHKLHTVIIDNAVSYSQPWEDYGIHEMCLMIPSLRKLHAKRTVTGFDNWRSGGEFPIESKVTDIVIEESSIGAESFARLFSRTKCLQSLTYGFLNWLHGHGDRDSMSFKETLEQYTAHTLTHLQVDFSTGTIGHFVGSLRQFQILKHLRIQGHMFKEEFPNLPEEDSIVDILPFLPASLETLTLLPQDEDPTTTYTLHELPKKRDEWVPNLSKITCESSFPFRDEVFDDCATVGVELVYT